MRAGFFIDGFNIYGAIGDLIKRDMLAGKKPPHYLKWMSYRTLCAWLARSPKRIETLNGFPGFSDAMSIEFINLYTAIPVVDKSRANWQSKESQVRRHMSFIYASEIEGVNVLHGKFKRNDRKCPECEVVSPKYEEKETDVHIAVDVVCSSLRDKIDVAFVFTADSDIAPAFECVRTHTDVKLVTVSFEPRRHSQELRALAHGATYIRRDSIGKSLLPKELNDPSSKRKVTRPSRYNPF